ncbi:MULTISPECIES: Zn-dependent hydrolase [Burkholderiaceae]|jgi:beta-ureidopropionase / N-carbamoyl-L-amino-acid hydrolase|uniref:Amidase, hydantoinase/carbamoylase family n=2 Tax=Paraburkholderia TaxID=1822464 RepID=B2SZB4_PARPJ|nr:MULTISPECIES: Zn-dependent hydrolase [Burkholderiaceae]MDR8399472.1 Zn-dependent hydrolase [Paraburkholderia sp. USG1]UTP22168.1 Zn-dependent hydrolase [Burkholderia sp. FXe9]HEP6277600.1 Zn-dependent hydrolase [Burkholderia vietnamiensis]ACD14493.1 amidase, hydantoinase/carbamoylase family [Paraburkholderia phytofirmans PsJN]ERJ39281.1 Acetylornithine deacetylase/Succinyl-diaminopimelate desuccinylase [Burkholderia sp. AU4i]
MSTYSIPSSPIAVNLPDADAISEFDALFRATSAIGVTSAGGLHRLAASEEDGRVRDLLRDWLVRHGFHVQVDRVGNLFGLVTFDPSAPYVLCGSHLDSQPSAGRFDGVYGVLAGAVAIAGIARRLRERGVRPPCNLAVVDWTNEEGARFQPSLTGSSVFTGALSVDDALACTDAQGITLCQALERIGYLGEEMLDIPVAAYVETHVEQGERLEREQISIGVVRETWAALKLRVRFDGEQSHTGPTPMDQRRDALRAAARAISAVYSEVGKHGDQMHGSVGRLDVYPNSPNVVPSKATLYVEFRSLSTDRLEDVGKRFAQILDDIAAQTGTHVEVESRQLRAPVALDSRLAQCAHDVCRSLGLRSVDSVTVAGHDAISLSRTVPSCLLFIPSHRGIAHNEAEFTEEADLHNGLRALSALLETLCVTTQNSR